LLLTDTLPTTIYPLSLHDALPISDHVSGTRPERRLCTDRRTPPRTNDDHRPHECRGRAQGEQPARRRDRPDGRACQVSERVELRSEEHTSELQLLTNLVCRLLLEK